MSKPKPGRQFEELIASIQSVLTERGKIIPNARRYDHDAKCDREIDVLVELSEGDQTFTTMIEVKDWKRQVDVRTIDAVESVRRSIRADVAVVVARNGFTMAARAKADALNIRLRTFEALTREDWISIFLPGFITVRDLVCEPRYFHVFDHEGNHLASENSPIDEARSFLDANGEPVPPTFGEIIQHMRSSTEPEQLHEFEPDGPPQWSFAVARLHGRNITQYLVDEGGALREARYAMLEGVWHLRRDRVPLAAQKYTGPNAKRGATIVESTFNLRGTTFTLEAVIPDPDDGPAVKIPISFRLSPHDEAPE